MARRQGQHFLGRDGLPGGPDSCLWKEKELHWGSGRLGTAPAWDASPAWGPKAKGRHSQTPPQALTPSGRGGRLRQKPGLPGLVPGWVLMGPRESPVGILQVWAGRGSRRRHGGANLVPSGGAVGVRWPGCRPLQKNACKAVFVCLF